jgi:hypothetical protein
MSTACTCGHSVEEHGKDPKYPGSTSCRECACIAYECDEDHDASGEACPSRELDENMGRSMLGNEEYERIFGDDGRSRR